MNKRLIKIAISTAIVTSSGIATAAPFNSFDPRSMAMGGAGVAVANTATAPFFNPSLLAVTRDEDNFAMELPIVGARAYDPDDFVDSVDNFQNAGYDSSLNNAINQIDFDIAANNAAALPGDYLIAANATADLNTGLQSLDSKPIQAELGAATVIGIPSKKIGVAFSASGVANLGGVVNYEDATLLGGIENDLRAIATADPACLDGTNTALCPSLTYIDTNPASASFLQVVNADGTPFDATNDVQSTVDVRGILLKEIAFSFSREFTLGKTSFAVGITPKYVMATVYDYQANTNTADNNNVDSADYAKDYSHFNFDIGVAKNYGNGWRTGFVLKNMIAQKYDTYRLNTTTGVKEKTGNVIELNPQARIGVSHSGEWHTIALDVDLTENDPVGFEDKSRYVALGGEVNLADWAQFRAGYRLNTLDSARNIASVGFGLSPFGIHLDIAAAQNADELGASVQLGFRF